MSPDSDLSLSLRSGHGLLVLVLEFDEGVVAAGAAAGRRRRRAKQVRRPHEGGRERRGGRGGRERGKGRRKGKEKRREEVRVCTLLSCACESVCCDELS